MLYLRWLETLHRFADQPAIFHDGDTIRFCDLASAVEALPRIDSPAIARTGSPEFFVNILRAWRDGQAVIPIEKDAAEPVLKCLPPIGCRLVKHTPGASGIPRGIFLNDAQVIADAEQIVETMSLTPDLPNLAVVSMAHSYGFSNLVLPLLLFGVPIHLVSVPFPRIVEAAMHRHSAMVVPAVPSMWRAWHRSGILRTAPIHLAISAGAPLALDLEQAVFSEAGLKIHNFYGASECGGIAFDDSETPRTHAAMVGRPLRRVQVSMAADGRFTVNSAAVATGYDDPRPDDQLGAGTYLTRDRGLIGENGEIHLTGTTGSAINVAGRKVSPAKVEAAILGTGLVEWVKVSGVPSPDAERFEEISATIDQTASDSLDRLKSMLTERLQSWEVPRHWKIDGSNPMK